MVLRSTKFKENYHINDSFDNIEIIGSDFDINIYPKVTDDTFLRTHRIFSRIDHRLGKKPVLRNLRRLKSQHTCN